MSDAWKVSMMDAAISFSFFTSLLFEFCLVRAPAPAAPAPAAALPAAGVVLRRLAGREPLVFAGGAGAPSSLNPGGCTGTPPGPIPCIMPCPGIPLFVGTIIEPPCGTHDC